MDNSVGSAMKSGYMLWTYDNKVFRCYLFWASILVIKLILMSIATAVRRMTTKSFANPEDARMNKGEVDLNNEKVERVRRAHLNDLENVVPFLVMALLYIATDPDATAARILIRIGACSRILHTLVYAFYPVPQPARTISFFITFLITLFMAGWVIGYNFRYI